MWRLDRKYSAIVDNSAASDLCRVAVGAVGLWLRSAAWGCVYHRKRSSTSVDQRLKGRLRSLTDLLKTDQSQQMLVQATHKRPPGGAVPQITQDTPVHHPGNVRSATDDIHRGVGRPLTTTTPRSAHPNSLSNQLGGGSGDELRDTPTLA